MTHLSGGFRTVLQDGTGRCELCPARWRWSVSHSNVLDIFRQGGFCPPVGNRLKPRDLDSHWIKAVGMAAKSFRMTSSVADLIEPFCAQISNMSARARSVENSEATAQCKRFLMNALRVIGLKWPETPEYARAPARGLSMARRCDGCSGSEWNGPISVAHREMTPACSSAPEDCHERCFRRCPGGGEHV